jgi:hypothetical protein
MLRGSVIGFATIGHSVAGGPALKPAEDDPHEQSKHIPAGRASVTEAVTQEPLARAPVMAGHARAERAGRRSPSGLVLESDRKTATGPSAVGGTR